MFAELKAKTNYSFLVGASHPHELVERACELGISAIGITDMNGVYALPKAHVKAKELSGVRLISGVELIIEDLQKPITLLASSREAYGLMCRMITRAFQRPGGAAKGKASLSFFELCRFLDEPAARGLFGLVDPITGGQFSFDLLKSYFHGRLYVTVSRFLDGHDTQRVDESLWVSNHYRIPLVATNDVLFHERTRRPLQDIVTSVKEGLPLASLGFKTRQNAERYLKSPFEMRRLFSDLPQALEATLEIASACQFSLDELKYRYPSEWIPAQHTAHSYLEELVYEGALERYRVRARSDLPGAVMSQLKHELELIRKLNYADYFLTIYDIVDYARKKDILCQGRGSAANSAVCYCLGITAIDPVRANLLFERFISLERNEPPDIDVDFEHERREEVIQYIYEKYGRNRAAMVSAVVTYQKRSAFREVSKAFGLPVGTLSAKKVMREFEEMAASSEVPDIKNQIETWSEELTTFPRHLSIHSGGFTLSADPITEIVPVEPASMEGRTIIQWDKYDLDHLGLLKIDVLSLGMLSALHRTLKSVGLQLHEVPAEDSETYRMIQRADTVGTFQVESRAQMNMSGRLRPRTFYDLVVQVAIVRPGPIVGQMVHPYLKRRQGLERVEYPHPKLREILGKTLGVPLFQEQLMKIAIELGEFSPGEADTLRRAIGAWRASGSIQKVAEKLLVGLRKNKIPETYALNILEHMKGFAHYGFPESHAASFALLTYASCYLKCHYPAEFACALVNSQPMGFYAVHSIIDDAKRHGVRVLPVHPNHSEWESRVVAPSTLQLGFHRVVGLSKQDALEIVQDRKEKGLFKNLSDFLGRSALKLDVLTRMAMGGAFECFGEDRRHSLWKILGERAHAGVGSEKIFEQMTLFEEVSADYRAFACSAQIHPMTALRKQGVLPKFTVLDAKRAQPKKKLETAGLLLVRQKPPTANGVCFAAIEDEHGILDLVLFAKDYERNKEIFLNHCFLKVSGYIEREGHSVSMVVKRVEPIWESSLNIEPAQYFW